MDSGFNNEIKALTIWDGKLVAGGSFTSDNSGNTTLNRIAYWDGNSWKPLGEGFSEVPFGYQCVVNGLAVHNGDLIAVGHFEFADGNTKVNSIARWDGNNWQAFGDGLGEFNNDLPFGVGISVISWNDKLVISGNFNNVDGVSAWYTATLDGNQWSDMTGSFTSPTRYSHRMVEYDDLLYGVGIGITNNGGVYYEMAYWDGSEWTGVVNTDVNWVQYVSLSEDESSMYFCGIFDSVNGVNTRGWAEWLCDGVAVSNVNNKDFKLDKPFPNPTNSETKLSFELDNNSHVVVTIYNIQGVKIAEITNEYLNAGTHTVLWNGKNNFDTDAKSGIYIMEIAVNGDSDFRRIVLYD